MFFPIIYPKIKSTIEIKLSRLNEYVGYRIRILPKLNPIIPNIVSEWYVFKNFWIIFIKINEPIPAPNIIGNSTVILITDKALK